MKMTIRREKPKPNFDPITVTITLETPNDLIYFAATLNVHHTTLKEASDYCSNIDYRKPENGYKRFTEINSYVNEWVDKCRAAGVPPLGAKSDD